MHQLLSLKINNELNSEQLESQTEVLFSMFSKQPPQQADKHF